MLGGGGRVGVSTIRSLYKLLHRNNSTASESGRALNGLEITIGGRNNERLKKAQKVLTTELGISEGPVDWIQLDAGSVKDVGRALDESKYKLVVNIAGPFQYAGKDEDIGAIGACIQRNVRYLDVCDSVDFARREQHIFQKLERENHTTECWVCTGIYPGVSNLMAAAGINRLGGPSEVESVKFSYYTAGSGGVGTTILASTFGLLAEDVETFDSRSGKVLKKAAAESDMVDFAGKVGAKEVYLLNLPEVVSMHDTLLQRGTKANVEAKFGTDPPIWNWLLKTTAALAPESMLRNKAIVNLLSSISIPVVRLVDKLSGATTAIRLDVTSRSGERAIVRYEHDSLERSVGEATAAFVFELLSCKDSTGDGFVYPEQLDADMQRRILTNATQTANMFSVESSVSQVDMSVKATS